MEQKIPFVKKQSKIFVATKKGSAGLFGLVLSFSLSLSRFGKSVVVVVEVFFDRVSTRWRR